MTEQDAPAEHSAGGAGKLGLPKTIGPLPIQVWAVAILGGVAVAYFVRKRATSSAATTAAAAATPATDPGSSLDGTAPATTGTTVPIGLTTQYSGVTTPTIDTNSAWQTQAEISLIGKGMAPLLVDRALSGYLLGNQLDTSEQAVITAALQTMGPPPQGAPVVTLGPTVTPPSPTTTKTVPWPTTDLFHQPGAPKYTVQSGDTWASLAAKFNTTGATLWQLNTGNLPLVAGGMQLHHGMQIRVPGAAPAVAVAVPASHPVVGGSGTSTATTHTNGVW